MMRLPTFVLLAATLIACSSDAGEDKEPTLEVTSPERGTFNDADSVVVTGRVTDDGKVTVTVNDIDAVVATDGTFTATVPVENGIAILETHARDAGGHDIRDVRAVLAGTLQTSDGSVASPIGARAGAAAIKSVGNVMADTANGIDFDGLVKAMNPVYNNTGCLGARVDITSVEVGDIDVNMVPETNNLSTDVSINNIVVKAHASFKAACIGGSTNITVSVTKARIHGDLGATLTGSRIDTSLPLPGIALDGFAIDVGGVPGAVEDLLRSKVREAVENSLAKVIRDKVPGIADKALAGLVSKPLTAALLGHETTVTVSPSIIEISPEGLFVAIDTTLLVAGGEGGMFVATSEPITPDLLDNASNVGGLGVAVANDAINQLFSGLWAAGALDQSVSIDLVGPLASILDDDVRTLDVALALPPTVTGRGGELTLAIGDLVVIARDANGVEVQKLALSLRTTLVARATDANKIALTVGTPDVKAQVLAQSEVVDRPLTDAQVEGIVTGVWGLVGSMADEALAKLPMPAVAGIQLGAPTVSGRNGFIVADIPLL